MGSLAPPPLTRLADDALLGLRAIEPLRGLRRRLLVYRGSAELRTQDRIDVWPASRFFDAVARGLLF